MSPSGLAPSPSRRFSARITDRVGEVYQKQEARQANHPPTAPHRLGSRVEAITPPALRHPASAHHQPQPRPGTETAPRHSARWPTLSSARHHRRTDSAPARPATAPAPRSHSTRECRCRAGDRRREGPALATTRHRIRSDHARRYGTLSSRHRGRESGAPRRAAPLRSPRLEIRYA